MPKEGRVRIGTSGWVYPHWRGVFYPADLPTAGHDARWLTWMENDGFDSGLVVAPSDNPATALGGLAAGTEPVIDGSLQVLEPPATSGLLDTIVGDVVASFLGK